MSFFCFLFILINKKNNQNIKNNFNQYKIIQNKKKVLIFYYLFIFYFYLLINFLFFFFLFIQKKF